MNRPMFPWASLPSKTGPRLSAQRLSDLPSSLPVYIASDSNGVRYLLIKAGSGSRLDLSSVRTRALEVRIESLSVSDLPAETFLILACPDPAFHSLFDTLLADAILAVTRSPEEAVDVVVQTVERWKRFCTIAPATMSEEGVLGLLGELWFLRHWVTKLTRQNLLAWKGPLEGTHDFQWSNVSVEVKTSASHRHPLRHRIAGLEQLEPPSSGDLYLFSLHLLEDDLAGNSLMELIRLLRGDLSSAPELRDLLDERIIAAGYGPTADDKAVRCYRVQSEQLYRVDEAFPKLVRSSFPSGLPPGVVNVTYEVSIDACAAFRVQSAEALFARLLST